MKLEALFLSKARAEIFRQLFSLRNAEMHLRAIQRGSGLSAPTIKEELEKLKNLDLVSVRIDGNRHYYSANKEHPLYREIRGLVDKTAGFINALRENLQRKGIKVAFIFGSLAAETENARSDIDLMVIGQVGLRQVVGWISKAAESAGREINPHVLTPNEYKRRLESKEHFLAAVLDSPKLFVIGNQDELDRLGKQWLAQSP